MCDYSLQAVKTRDAAVDDKLVTCAFWTGTTGFAPINRDVDNPVAVCIIPGTEIAFDAPIKVSSMFEDKEYPSVAVFAQLDKDNPHAHHDCLQFANGEQVLLTRLAVGQTARVLQLPAAPKTSEEEQEQERAAFVG